MQFWETDIEKKLWSIREQKLYRQIEPHDHHAFPFYHFNGRSQVNFASNDYLGITAHPKIIQAWKKGLCRWGAGAGASHLLGGYTEAHQECEQNYAEFLGHSRALLFPSGYQANITLISALVSRGDTCIQDRLNHASLIDGARLSGSRLLRYRHLDIHSCESRLRQAEGTKLLVTDGVFSMDGDVPDLRKWIKLSQQYRAIPIVDDAHGFGVLGEEGRGSLHFLKVDPGAVAGHVVTLGKAMGIGGAIVSGSQNLIDLLIQKGRGFMFSTGIPPAQACAITEALNVVRVESWRREKLQENIDYFKTLIHNFSLPLAESVTAIQPLIVGNTEDAVRLAEEMKRKGFYVPAVRPPAVPKGSARLRITLSASHDQEMVRNFAQALHQAWKSCVREKS